MSDPTPAAPSPSRTKSCCALTALLCLIGGIVFLILFMREGLVGTAGMIVDPGGKPISAATVEIYANDDSSPVAILLTGTDGA